jgi:acyl carrier protein
LYTIGAGCAGRLTRRAQATKRLFLTGPDGPGRAKIPGQVKLMDDIEQKVIEIVSEQMGVDKSEITRETHFINDLNADSLDTVELVMEFEDEFELSIPDEEAEKIQTVGQAIDYIKEHASKNK